MSRQAGGQAAGGQGMGSRGPGETKIELDRRRINQRMAKLRREIKEMKTSRDTKRSGRKAHEVPSVAIAGYTNAGKSSLLNRLTGAGVLVENQLFATLDPTVRRLKLPGGRRCTISDTVGFVSKLPHDLVEAFRSTLEEVTLAELIVHVADASSPELADQIDSVRRVLEEIGAGSIPEVLVLNKIDLLSGSERARVARRFPGSVPVSASTGEGIEGLLEVLEETLPHPPVTVELLVPYGREDVIALLYRESEVQSTTHDEEGTVVHARVGLRELASVRPFVRRESWSG
jgi:GTP-binding protein HflX